MQPFCALSFCLMYLLSLYCTYKCSDFILKLFFLIRKWFTAIKKITFPGSVEFNLRIMKKKCWLLRYLSATLKLRCCYINEHFISPQLSNWVEALCLTRASWVLNEPGIFTAVTLRNWGSNFLHLLSVMYLFMTAIVAPMSHLGFFF